MTAKNSQPDSAGKDPKSKGPKIIKLKPTLVVYRKLAQTKPNLATGVFHAKATRKTESRDKTKPSQASKGRAKNNPPKAADLRKARKAAKK